MKRWSMLIGLLLVALTACGGGSGGTTAQTAASGSSAASASGTAGTGAGYSGSTGAAAASPAAGAAEADQGAQPVQQTQFDRLVIRTATQQFVVADVDTAEAQVRQIADERGGFVLSAESSGSDEARSATVTIKVPAQRFDETLTTLAKLAQKVESQQVQGQDVTDEYVDLESRLRNLRTLEARLLQFLQQATTIEDSLRVSDQLARTQGEIEQTQGRMKYLRESAQLATITVMLRGTPIAGIALEAGWSPLATASRALQGVLRFGQGLITLLIVVAVWLPVWGPLALAGIWLWRRVYRVPVTPA
jgi:hypothetical protein